MNEIEFERDFQFINCPEKKRGGSRSGSLRNGCSDFGPYRKDKLALRPCGMNDK